MNYIILQVLQRRRTTDGGDTVPAAGAPAPGQIEIRRSHAGGRTLQIPMAAMAPPGNHPSAHQSPLLFGSALQGHSRLQRGQHCQLFVHFRRHGPTGSTQKQITIRHSRSTLKSKILNQYNNIIILVTPFGFCSFPL